MSEPNYTREELEWLDGHRKVVRALIAATPKRMASAKDEIAGTVDKAAKGLLASMRKNLSKVDARTLKVGKDIEDNRRYIEQDREAGKPPEAIFVEYVNVDGPARLAACAGHRAALLAKIETMTADPEACLLPIGTVVSFAGVPAYVNSLGILDDRRSYPVQGSVGVVTHICQKGEFALAVSMRRPYRDGWNNEIIPGDDRMPTYWVDRDMLEIVGYGLLPNGEEYRGYAHMETHERNPEWSDEGDGPEMILEADGFFWRFHDFGGEQAIEALQAYESLSEMPWIGEPLDASVKIPAPAPKP